MLDHPMLQDISAVATAIAVVVAAWQLFQTRRQERATFEDALAREFRDVAERIPVKALLGQELLPEELATALPAFYRYVDLCNEQAFLRLNGRVSRATWTNWSSGMRALFRRPAFRGAWEAIKLETGGSFEELRLLDAFDFFSDPRAWRRRRPKVPLDAIAR